MVTTFDGAASNQRRLRSRHHFQRCDAGLPLQVPARGRRLSAGEVSRPAPTWRPSKITSGPQRARRPRPSVDCGGPKSKFDFLVCLRVRRASRRVAAALRAELGRRARLLGLPSRQSRIDADETCNYRNFARPDSQRRFDRRHDVARARRRRPLLFQRHQSLRRAHARAGAHSLSRRGGRLVLPRRLRGRLRFVAIGQRARHQPRQSASARSWQSESFEPSFTGGVGVGYIWGPHFRTDLTVDVHSLMNTELTGSVRRAVRRIDRRTRRSSCRPSCSPTPTTTFAPAHPGRRTSAVASASPSIRSRAISTITAVRDDNRIGRQSDHRRAVCRRGHGRRVLRFLLLLRHRCELPLPPHRRVGGQPEARRQLAVEIGDLNEHQIRAGFRFYVN